MNIPAVSQKRHRSPPQILVHAVCLGLESIQRYELRAQPVSKEDFAALTEAEM
jgi:hypothetical protein